MIATEQTGIPMDRIDARLGRHRPRARRAAARWARARCSRAASPCTRPPIELVDKAQKLAAELLEADVADVVLDKDAGAFHVAGTPAVAKTWADLRRRRARPTSRLTHRHAFYRGSGATFPFGAHVAVVEVDTETGQVKHLRHVACDDAGRVLNPMLLEGQIHGGVAQGTAQALLEEVRYDDDGNPITSNLADYAMISAAELPSFEVVHMETPTSVNPLGAKGIGEIGHDRLDAGGAVGGGRRGQPPRRAPHRHARHRRAGLAGDPRCGVTAAADRTAARVQPSAIDRCSYARCLTPRCIRLEETS